jgi:ABC-type lipoprotein export system ATPase subunit
MKTDQLVLRAENLHKVFHHKGGDVNAVSGIDFEMSSGEIIAIRGRSGAGKSTLLHVLAGLEAPSRGRVFFNDRSVYDLNDEQRSEIRARSFGFIFQAHHLLPEFTAIENALIPVRMLGKIDQTTNERADRLFAVFGLTNRKNHLPAELSGGECQRVGLIRALINKPAVIFADEPTGNLDREHAEDILKELSRVVSQEGSSLIIVTHDPRVTEIAGRVVVLDDGRING